MTFIDISNIFWCGGGGGRGNWHFTPPLATALLYLFLTLLQVLNPLSLHLTKFPSKIFQFLETEKERCWLSFLAAYLRNVPCLVL